MARVKRGTTHVKSRRNLLKKAKGFKWGRKKLIRLASTAVTHAGVHAYRDRKKKKADFRHIWTVRISAALGDTMSYSKFIGALKKQKIDLNRKMLADLAENHPSAFSAVVKEAKVEKAPAKEEKKEKVAA